MNRGFNLILSLKEVWGVGNKKYHLNHLFLSNFEEKQLVVIVPNVLVLTLSNGCCGKVGIYKRMDVFFYVEGVV